MHITAAPSAQKNWFTSPRIQNNTIYQSPAQEVADSFAMTSTITGVATGAAALAGAMSPNWLGGAALTVAGAAAGLVAGAMITPFVSLGATQLFHADNTDDGGTMAGGAVLGTVAGGAGALAGSLGASPGGVALSALGASALVIGGLIVADHRAR